MKCSSCGGTRVNGCIQHATTCPSYQPSSIFRDHPDLTAEGWPTDLFATHPDLVEIESDVAYWFGDGPLV